jgi:hypothetical protein
MTESCLAPLVEFIFSQYHPLNLYQDDEEED